MGKFTVGQVVSNAFPFSNLSTHKYRPALIVALAEFDNIVLCQITSKPYSGSLAIALEMSDFTNGSLPLKSYIRPDKLFTAEQSIVSKVYGELKLEKIQQVQTSLRNLFDQR